MAVNVSEDIVFLTACRTGNADAFAGIVRKYQDRIFNLSWRLVGDYEEARDVTQTVFLKAYESLDGFRGGSALYTWLYRIAVNTALDWRKSARRRTERNMDDIDNLAVDRQYVGPRSENGDGDGPLEKLVGREQERRIAQAIGALDPDHRAVLVLRDVEGLDYAHISEVLELAPGTVKSRLHRARCLLRDSLKDLIE